MPKCSIIQTLQFEQALHCLAEKIYKAGVVDEKYLNQFVFKRNPRYQKIDQQYAIEQLITQLKPQKGIIYEALEEFCISKGIDINIDKKWLPYEFGYDPLQITIYLKTTLYIDEEQFWDKIHPKYFNNNVKQNNGRLQKQIIKSFSQCLEEDLMGEIDKIFATTVVVYKAEDFPKTATVYNKNKRDQGILHLMIDKLCTLHRIITKESFSEKMLDDLHFMKKNPTILPIQNWLGKIEYDNKEYLQKKQADKRNNVIEKQQPKILIPPDFDYFQDLQCNNGLFSLSLKESPTSLLKEQLSICLENQEKENKEILCPFTANEMIKQLKSYDEQTNVKVQLESLQLFQSNETYKYRNKSELTRNLDQTNPLNKYNTFIHELEEKYTQEVVKNRNDFNWLDMEVKNVIDKIQWSKGIILNKLMEQNQNVIIVEEANLEKYIENLVDEMKIEQLDESFNHYITDKAYFYGLGINALYFDPADQIIYVWKNENKYYVYLDKNKFLVTIILQNNIGIFQHAHFAINDMPFKLCLRCQKHFEKEGYVDHLCAKETQTMDKCQNQILIEQILKREQQNSEFLQNDL